jgi:hypothetical protein
MRLKPRMEDIIIVDIKDTKWEGVVWFHVVLDRKILQDAVNALIKMWVV